MIARIILACLVLAPSFASAQSTREIFRIERSKNRNVVRYDARIGKDAQLDPKEPVTQFWLGPDGRRWPVKAFDRTFFYGFSVRRDKSGAFWHLTIAAAKDRPLKLYLKDGKPRAETTIAGGRAFLQKLYVRFAEKTLLPSVSYVDLIGIDVRTGAPRRERVVP